MVATGTHKDDLMGVAATGKQASFPVCLVLELRDGKIYREREYYDSMVIFAQLGVVTPPGQE
jgi:predicted ester cyclase